ncbi:HprK-related kinase B [Magnetospira thiophila]
MEDVLTLDLGECGLSLRSNSAALMAQLRDYFGPRVVSPRPCPIEIFAIEREALDLGLDFTDWARAPEKSGRKDSYVDLPGARLLRKVQTGMLFLQSETLRIAAGPCRRNDNQLINFINAQYMTWLQNRDWLICHASGVVRRGRCLAMAGFSGGGKSTLMLNLMDDPGVSFLTNDRLFIKQQKGGSRALGIAKLPRVNPGTIVHNAALHGLLSPVRRQALLALPPGDLWQIEEKYDVPVDEIYPGGQWLNQAEMAGLLVLNWRRDSTRPLTVDQVDLQERRDLLAAIMKSPGPFYQSSDGRFLAADQTREAQAYLEALKGVPVHEAQGRIDFAGLARYCRENLI